MSARDRRHVDPGLIDELLMPWESDPSAGYPSEPQLTELEDDLRPILGHDGEVLLLVGNRKRRLGFDPARAR